MHAQALLNSKLLSTRGISFRARAAQTSDWPFSFWLGNPYHVTDCPKKFALRMVHMCPI